MIRKSKNMRSPLLTHMIVLAVVCTIAYKFSKILKNEPEQEPKPVRKPSFVQFHRMSASYGVAMSMIRSRLDALISEVGCTAAAAICGNDGGKIKYFMAGSGDAPVKMIFPSQRIISVPQIFQSIPALGPNGNIYARDRDAEFKILNVIAEILNNSIANHSPDLWIMLHVEQTPCLSCTNAISAFRLKFPDVKFEVSIGATGVRKLLKKIAKTIKDKDSDAIGELINVSRSFKS